MAIYLGNLTIKEFEKRTGYNFSEEDRKWLEAHKQESATVKFDSGKFHIFDILFMMQASEEISDELLKLLLKYENISPSKESLQFAAIHESPEEKEIRIKREQEEQKRKDQLADPKSIWNIKWWILIPVKVTFISTISLPKYIKSNATLYYGCFINTYTTGRENVPDILQGYVTISNDAQGFHGTFVVDNPEQDDDANEHRDWNYVIGSSLYDEHGDVLDINCKYALFDKVTCSIKDGIMNYRNLHGGTEKEIHFWKTKK